MKSRLTASFYLYFSGTCWRNTRSIISSNLTSFNRRHGQITFSLYGQGFQKSNRAVHSSALKDDTFSELGPRISECAAKKIKLITEKPDDYVDDDFSELGPGISECTDKKIKMDAEEPDDFVDDDFSELGLRISERTAKKTKLATEKPNDFMDDDFSNLGLGISKSAVKKIKLVTEKPDDFVDDGFSELGLAISKCTTNKIKLLTEKPEFFLKTRPCRRELRRCLPSSDNRSSVVLEAIVEPSRPSGPKLGDHDQAPSITNDTRNISDIETPRSVCIKNIPSTVGLTELVEAISVFGKVSGASFVTTSNRLRCCNIQFEDVESSRRAILSGKVKVGNQDFPVDPLDAVDLVTVRIKNINELTADYEIHSTCKSIGELVGLRRTGKDCVDAFFNVQNHTVHLDIVKRLNNTTVDLNRWSAHVLTSKSKLSDIPSYEEARYKLGLHIFDNLSYLTKQLAMKKIYLEDLQYLNASIMHLEAVPTTPNRSATQPL